jgi:hypothetical protein
MRGAFPDGIGLNPRLPLADASGAYAKFQEKEDGMVKVLLQP